MASFVPWSSRILELDATDALDDPKKNKREQRWVLLKRFDK